MTTYKDWENHFGWCGKDELEKIQNALEQLLKNKMFEEHYESEFSQYIHIIKMELKHNRN